MPPQAADLEEALKKKGGLTLTQLATYDDLITDALVDRVYYWSTIRKLRANYHACRGVQEESVCKIIQDEAVVNKDPAAAQDLLLKLPGLAKYHRGLGTTDEKEHFLRHLRKYINMYLPDCPFEVGTTNRYTIMTAEASIIARKAIRKGEPIKYLSGIQVEMSEREEKELCSRTDFSIVLSSRRKRPSLFLGPARFANHDCDSNAKLNTTGPHGIHIVARKDISVGDEITVTYGLDYFGEDNCECLCATCEGFARNGWDPRGLVLNESSDDESGESESEAPNVKPTRAKTPVQRGVSDVNANKRKREDEVPSNADADEEIPRKRGRGRPRKHPRPDDIESAPQILPNATSNNQIIREDGLPVRRRSGPNHIGSTENSNATGFDSDVRPRNARNAGIHKAGHSGTARTDETAQRIWKLLHDVAERKGRVEEIPNRGKARISSNGIPTPQTDVEVECVARPRDSQRSPVINTTSKSNKTVETVADGDSAHINTRSRVADASGGSKLPAIKKERSFSRLRNVINVDDTRDPFSIPASPAPSTRTSQRKRGRPRKNVLPEKEASLRESTSPSSAGNDSASYASVASSATSLDVFAAGSIAENICELYTTGVKKEAEPSEDVVVAADPPRRMSTRSALRQQISEETHVAESSNARIRASLGSSDQAATSETKPVAHRSSARKLTSDSLGLAAAVRSIEKTDNPVKPVRRGKANADEDGENDDDDEDNDDDDDDDDVKRGPARTPGDYTLCEILLTTPYHRWVECRNCDEFFLQGDAYLTRIACPRCERHSKLYGYYWPKTDREGKHDKDERVLDHRTIHRFIDPEEERGERKGRRTLAHVLREKEMSERQESEESDGLRGERRLLRGSPRGGDTRRKLRATM